MIFSYINIPSVSEQTVEKNEAFLNFSSHLAILGSIILNLPGDHSDSNEEENEYIKTLLGRNSCFVESLNPQQDKIATIFLDAGARVVFFTTTTDDDTSKVEEDILSTFPRSRIGILLPQDPNMVQQVVQKYKNIAGHFLYK